MNTLLRLIPVPELTPVSPKANREDGALWGLAPTHLNEDQCDNRVVLGPGSHPVSTLFDEAFRGSRGEPNTTIAAINSNHVDIRMMVQHAEFTIHGTADPMESLPNNERFLVKVIVPSAAKASLKQALALFGISEAALFPDLEHLAKELRGLRFKE